MASPYAKSITGGYDPKSSGDNKKSFGKKSAVSQTPKDNGYLRSFGKKDK